MFKKVNCKLGGNLLEEIKDKDRVIIVYHWNSCGHCRSFMPILYNLLNEDRDLTNMANIFEVEYDDFKYLPKELTNVSAFPSVVSIEKGKKKDEFKEQRTPENLREFIKSNSSLSNKSSSSSSNKSSSSSSLSSKRIKKQLRKYKKKN
jgi:thioredoxin-like negative regulator of GroEL